MIEGGNKIIFLYQFISKSLKLGRHFTAYEGEMVEKGALASFRHVKWRITACSSLPIMDVTNNKCKKKLKSLNNV